MTETRAFLNAFSAAVTGVTVVTTKTPAGPVGHTISAMCQVSDVPPTLLVALPRGCAVATAIAERGSFAVNVLADHQAGVAEAFRGSSVFAQRDWWPMGRLPLLQGAAACFECDVVRTVENGAAVLVIGVVTRAVRGRARPLAYARRGYLAPLAA